MSVDALPSPVRRILMAARKSAGATSDSGARDCDCGSPITGIVCDRLDAPIQRDRTALFAPTLGATIANDDPMRLVDEALVGMDWSEWVQATHCRLDFIRLLHGRRINHTTSDKLSQPLQARSRRWSSSLRG